jgi:hypothetical protein
MSSNDNISKPFESVPKLSGKENYVTWKQSVRDLAGRDSRTRTSKPDRTMPHHVCEQLRYGYFGDIGQHERSKDRANRTVESLALIVLYRPPPSHTKPRRALLFFDMGQATGRRALLFSEDNKQHATRDAYCSLRADETREQQPKIRGPRLRTEQD